MGKENAMGESFPDNNRLECLPRLLGNQTCAAVRLMLSWTHF